MTCARFRFYANRENNLAERVLRGPVIGRRLSFGSDSENGARFHGRDVLGRRHARLERHRRPALAGSVAGSMREERRPAAGRPVAVAAMVDERGAQARLHGGSMTGRVECRYYGRDFTAGEIALLRALIAVDPQPTRAGLSREFCRRIGWFKPDGGLKDMMAQGHHAGHAPRRPHRPATAQGPAAPAKARRFRAGHRAAAASGPDNPRRGSPDRPAPRRPRDPRGQAVERVRRPLPLSRLQDPRRRLDALRRPRPKRLAHRHARLLNRHMEARSARQLHRLDATIAREEPPARRRQSEVPDPALDHHPKPGLAHPRPNPPAPAPGLGRALQHNARAHRDLRRNRRDTPAPSTGPPAGSMLAPPRGAGAMIGTSCTTNPARTSGSDPCEKTGNAPSIARICGIG